MGVHLLKGAIRGGWRKEWLELSTTKKKMRKGEWLNWLLCLLTGHQDAMATSPDLKFREDDSLILLFKTQKKDKRPRMSQMLLLVIIYSHSRSTKPIWLTDFRGNTKGEAFKRQKRQKCGVTVQITHWMHNFDLLFTENRSPNIVCYIIVILQVIWSYMIAFCVEQTTIWVII